MEQLILCFDTGNSHILPHTPCDRYPMVMVGLPLMLNQLNTKNNKVQHDITNSLKINKILYFIQKITKGSHRRKISVSVC